MSSKQSHIGQIGDCKIIYGEEALKFTSDLDDHQ